MTNYFSLPFTLTSSGDIHLDAYWVGFALGLVWFGFGLILRIFRRASGVSSSD